MEELTIINIYNNFLEELNKFSYFRGITPHKKMFIYANDEWQKIVDEIDDICLKGVLSIQSGEEPNRFHEYLKYCQTDEEIISTAKYLCEMIGTANHDNEINMNVILLLYSTFTNKEYSFIFNLLNYKYIVYEVTNNITNQSGTVYDNSKNLKLIDSGLIYSKYV